MASDASAPIKLGKVLVVGGCGFLGYHVVDQLLNFPSENGLPPSHPSTVKKASRADATLLNFPTLRSRYPVYEKTDVHVLDLRCTHNRLPGATYHQGDLCDPDSLLDIFRKVKPEVVINTASPLYNAAREILRKVNIEGTKDLLQVAGGLHGDWGGSCKAFVHTSSSSVVHDALSDLINADERRPYVRPHPVEYYTETKACVPFSSSQNDSSYFLGIPADADAEESVLQANNKHNGMLTCAIRPAGIVGEKDRGGFTDGLLTTAANAPDWQLHVQLGSGDNLFDCTYVGNVAYGLAIAAEALSHTHARIAKGQTAPLDYEKVDGEAFNVTNDSPAYFWDLARYVWTLYGRAIAIDKVWQMSEGFVLPIGALAELSTYITGRKTKITRQSIKYSSMTRYYSCDKLKKRCGYTPLVGLQEGLERAVKSYVLDEMAEKTTQGNKKVQ